MPTSLSQTIAMFAAVVALTARPAGVAAQTGDDKGAPRVAVTGAFEAANQYFFRGVRQNATGMVFWPTASVRARVYQGDGVLKQLTVTARTFNSLHTGDTGSGGPMDRLWYESDAAGAIGFHFGGGLSTEFSYTAYTSPNNMFSTAKEAGVRLSIPLRVTPYAFIAVELEPEIGEGLDGGNRRGTYLELGATAEVFQTRRLTVATPVKVGLSLSNYYEHATKDHTLGFISVGAIGSLHIVRSPHFGGWTAFGGAEYQRLGRTATAFNRGQHSEITWRAGLSFAR